MNFINRVNLKEIMVIKETPNWSFPQKNYQECLTNRKEHQMLDKSKIYSAYSKPYRGKNQSPQSRFRRIKILFEDDIGLYVESLTEKDQRGYGKRFSVKKHCFHLKEVEAPKQN